MKTKKLEIIAAKYKMSSGWLHNVRMRSCQAHQPFSLTRDLFTLYLSFVLSQTSGRRQRRLWSFSYICTYEKNPLHFRFYWIMSRSPVRFLFRPTNNCFMATQQKQSGKTVDYKKQQKIDSNNNSTDWADQVIELDLNC